MTNMLGFVTMPGVAALNKALVQAGLVADVVVVNRRAGLEFGRRASSPYDSVNTPESIAAAAAKLTQGVNTVWRALGLSTSPDGLVNLTAVGYAVEPHNLAVAGLVEVTRGPGFLIGQNPHPPCLALVTPADLAVDLALLTPFADAPPIWGVYIGRRRDGTWFVITFCIMATWHRLPETEGDLIRRTIWAVRRQVEVNDAAFSYDNLWVFVGPSASEGFTFQGNRSDRLSPQEKEQFVHTELIPNPQAGQLGELDVVEMPYLDLRGWAASIFRTLEVVGRRIDGSPVHAGVPEYQLFVSGHNTVRNELYASKRRELPGGEAAPGSSIGSSALVGVIRRLA